MLVRYLKLNWHMCVFLVAEILIYFGVKMKFMLYLQWSIEYSFSMSKETNLIRGRFVYELFLC
mgnify:CR=1 FL=1